MKKTLLAKNYPSLEPKSVPKTLVQKIADAKRAVKGAYKLYGNKLCIFWTGGKDSTVLMDIMRRTLGNRIVSNLPTVYIDTQLDFQDVYDFIEKMKKQWNINLIRERTTPKEMAKYNALKKKSERVVLASLYKIILLKRAVKKYKLPAIVIGIRWDEHAERIAEKYLSPRKDHVRIHPLLPWHEKDIWAYTKKLKVPYIALYDKGYRSLGEKEFTNQGTKEGGERSGRAKGREVIMKRLRTLGYF